MAHALDRYNGLCKNIHGHTYHFSLTVLGTVCDNEERPDNGMVIDFGLLKQLVKETIIEKFDHALVLKQSSAFLTENIASNERLIITLFQPTCENLLMYFVKSLKQVFPTEVTLVAARLDETPTSYAEWLLNDQ